MSFLLISLNFRGLLRFDLLLVLIVDGDLLGTISFTKYQINFGAFSLRQRVTFVHKNEEALQEEKCAIMIVVSSGICKVAFIHACQQYVTFPLQTNN